MDYPQKKQMILVLCALFFQMVYSQTIYVQQDATGSGTSWADATGNLQQALQNANFGTQVWVAKGSYFPTTCNPCIAEDRQIFFQVKNGVQLIGGFSGNETNIEQRNIANNPTILSGNIDQDNTPWSNSHTIIYTQDVGDQTLIDGFIIEEGTADFSNASAGNLWQAGAGLYNDAATPDHFSEMTVRNCTFRNNLAKGFGGAVMNDGAFSGSCLPTFENCLFENNTGELGGGAMYNNGIFNGICSPIIKNCIFNDNDSPFSNGGAISNQGAEDGVSNPVFSDCVFNRNISVIDAGAVYNFGKSGVCNPSFFRCDFNNNESHDGGAIYNDGTFQGESNPTFDKCNFVTNKSTNGNGGAVYNSGIEGGLSSPIFTNCLFNKNESSAAAGAVFNNGDMGDSSPDFINCIFSENLANEIAGAVYNLGKAGNSSPLFMNCLLYRNRAFTSAAGIYNLGSEFGNASPTITNCTFYDNSAPISGAVYNNASNENGTSNTIITNCIFWGNNADLGKVLRNIWSTPTISNSIVDVADCDELNSTSGNADLTCGAGILFNQYPAFVDTLANNFRLLMDSPAIDMGSNMATIQTGVGVDLDSFPRIVDNGVDYGAYEFGSNANPSPVITQNPVSQSVCVGETVTLTVTATDPTNLSYQWQKDGANINGANNPSFILNNIELADIGEYRCLVSNQFNLVSISQTAEISVSAALSPSVFIEASMTEICAGDDVTLSAIIENGGAFPFFQWFINGNAFGASIQTFTINSLNDGDVISVILTSNADCLTTNTVSAEPVSFTVNSFVNAFVSVDANLEEICEGEEVIFNAIPINAGDDPIYTWFVNNDEQPGSTEFFSTRELQEGDVVSCQLTSNAACVQDSIVLSNSASVLVKEFVNAAISITDFSEEICEGDQLFLFSVPANEGNAPSFEWFVNDVPQGINSIDFLATDLIDQSEIYIRLISSQDCIIEDTVFSQTVIISVLENVFASVEIDASIDTTICVGDTVFFTASPQNGGQNPIYNWTINGDFQPETGSIFQSNDLVDGDQIQGFLVSSLVCADDEPVFSNIIEVSVDSCINNTVSLIPASAWAVYPNPTDGLLNIIMYENFSPVSIEVLNILGQVALKPIHTTDRTYLTDTTLDLSNLKAGVYVIKLSDGKTFATKRVIKQ